MILSLLNDLICADRVLISASHLAACLSKSFGVLLDLPVSEVPVYQKSALKKKLNELAIKPQLYDVRESKSYILSDYCEVHEISFLFLQLTGKNRKYLLKTLSLCRDLRIPYLLFRHDFPVIDFSKIIIPVSFLNEEIEKAQFAAAFGRYCGSSLVLLKAGDYGTKAQRNVLKICSVLDSFQLVYQVEQGIKDSFKIEYEAVEHAANRHFGLVMVSASREYGLDDVIFGPKELHLIIKTEVPLLLINPRSDLYVLCD